jgi:hypothetical protein
MFALQNMELLGLLKKGTDLAVFSTSSSRE